MHLCSWLCWFLRAISNRSHQQWVICTNMCHLSFFVQQAINALWLYRVFACFVSFCSVNYSKWDWKYWVFLLHFACPIYVTLPPRREEIIIIRMKEVGWLEFHLHVCILWFHILQTMSDSLLVSPSGQRSCSQMGVLMQSFPFCRNSSFLTDRNSPNFAVAEVRGYLKAPLFWCHGHC